MNAPALTSSPLAWIMCALRRRAFWRFVHRQRREARAERRGHHRALCAWCDRLLRGGDPRMPASHGICASCREATLSTRIQRYRRTGAYLPASRG